MKTPVKARAAQASHWVAKWLFLTSQFFWPWLEKLTPKQERDLEDSLKKDEARIEALDFDKDTDAALEEARRVADSEAERRRSTDQKAATYLPLVAALIPLVLTLVSALWEKKAGSAPIWLNMVLLGLAVAYTASAGYWAFKELKVSVSHEPGLTDFEKAWSVRHPSQTLARRLLLHTRRNGKGVNWKVTCIKMAHEYLLRAFLTFSVLLLVNIGWYLAGAFIGASWPTSGSMLATPRQAIHAVAEIESLGAQLKTTEGWTVLERDCQRRTAGRTALTFAPEAVKLAAKIPAVFRVAASEIVAVQNIRLACAGKPVGLVRAWFIPARLDVQRRSLGLPDPLAVRATNAVAALTNSWPPTDAKVDPAQLPAVLLQQTDMLRDSRGRTIVLAITAVGPGAITIQ